MESIIELINKPSINIYLCNKYNFTYGELLHHVSNYFKKMKSNETALKYYYDNKDDNEYQDKLRLSRCSYYNKNKSKIRALILAKCDNDPIFREQYQKYQALYSQRRRGCKHVNETRGRPSKYSLLERN